MFSLNSLRRSSRVIPYLVAALLLGSSTDSIAQITLGALTRDGYGVVPIKRPQPNVLVVVGTVNGHKARLVLAPVGLLPVLPWMATMPALWD